MFEVLSILIHLHEMIQSTLCRSYWIVSYVNHPKPHSRCVGYTFDSYLGSVLINWTQIAKELNFKIHVLYCSCCRC